MIYPIPFIPFLLLGTYVSAKTLHPFQINGKTWACPYNGQNVDELTGIITAWTHDPTGGFWIRGASDNVDATSDSIHIICAKEACSSFEPQRGLQVRIDGVVDCSLWGRKRGDLNTRVVHASRISVVNAGMAPEISMEPVILGVHRTPLTEVLSSLDERDGRFYEHHRPIMYQSQSNMDIDPVSYGLDFWRSLESELVMIPKPVAIAPGSMMDKGFWVIDLEGQIDANPEAILVAAPLDGGQNPVDIPLNTGLTDIIGILTYRQGTYRVLPITSPKVTSWPNLRQDLTKSSITNGLVPGTNCEKISIVTYNVQNLGVAPRQIQSVAEEIDHYLNRPSIVFLQEIMDDNPDHRPQSAAILKALVDQIERLNGLEYHYVVVEPTGQLGAIGSTEERLAAMEVMGTGHMVNGKLTNIRNVILYRGDQLELVDMRPGRATESTNVQIVNGRAQLTLNPGFINPGARPFDFSRKGLAALFRTKTTGKDIWAINVHLTSKGYSSYHGDIRPPLNKGLSWRDEQAGIYSDFVRDILAADPTANVVLAGDFNEAPYSQRVFRHFEGVLEDAMDVTKMPFVGRYTVIHQMNSQMLDHVLVSPSLADMDLEAEIVHINTWAIRRDRTSDHDPVAVSWKMCGAAASTSPIKGGVVAKANLNKETRPRMPKRSA